MNLTITANILGLIGSLLMMLAGIIKEKKKILQIQILQMIFLTISNILLKSFTGGLVNIVAIIRNILAYYNKFNKTIMYIFITITIAFLYFNKIGLIGILPVIATILLTIGMIIKDDKNFKIILLISVICWLIHDIYIKSYTTAVFDLLTIILSIISIYKQTKSA